MTEGWYGENRWHEAPTRRSTHSSTPSPEYVPRVYSPGAFYPAKASSRLSETTHTIGGDAGAIPTVRTYYRAPSLVSPHRFASNVSAQIYPSLRQYALANSHAAYRNYQSIKGEMFRQNRTQTTEDERNEVAKKSVVIAQQTLDELNMLKNKMASIASGFQTLITSLLQPGASLSVATPSSTTPGPQMRVGVRRAVVVGIDYVGTSNELHGCTTDALNIARFLCARGYTDITLLLDRHVSSAETANLNLCGRSIRAPTRANILTSIVRMLQAASPSDRCFLHFSGHGTSVSDTNGDEEDGMDEMLVPLDVQREGGIVDDELCQILKDNMHPDTLLTCLMDCCHSGSVLDLSWNLGGQGQGPFGKTTTAHQSGSHPSIIMISGCQDAETSGDTPAGGVMTQAFLATMRDTRTESLSLQAVFEGLHTWIQKNHHRQHPVISCNMANVDPFLCKFLI